MKLLRRIFTLLFFLFLINFSTSAQSIAVDAKSVVNTEKADVTITLLDQRIVNIRIVNILSPQDTYEPITILNEQEYVFFSLKLKTGRNRFLIQAFSKDDIVDEAKITIERKDAPSSSVGSYAPTKPADQGQQPQTQPGETPKPAKTPDSGKKLKLQSARNAPNRSTAIITVDRKDLDPQFGTYAIEVKSDKKTVTPPEVAMITEKGKIKDTQDIEVPLSEGENTVTIYPKVNGKDQKEFGNEIKINCTDCSDSGQSTSTRAVVGFEQIGASSARSKQNPFLEFYFDTPFYFGSKENKAKKGPDFSVWGKIRFSSIPVQTLVSFSNLSTFSGLLTDDKKSNELTQSFDFLMGLEKELSFIQGLPGLGFIRGKSSMYVIAAGGAISPLAPDKAAQIFKIPTSGTPPTVDEHFLKLFPEAAGKKNIAFVSPERDRFFRQYLAGVRFKTFFYDKDGKKLDIFPAMYDFTVGQNEAITGSLKGVILKFDGSTPLPIKGADYLYIFGAAQLRMGRKINTSLPSFFLEPAESTTNLFSTDTVVVPFDRYPQTISNRDIFRIGIGVDLFRLFNQNKDKDKAKDDEKDKK